MIKVQITKNNIVTNETIFPSLEEAQAWYTQESENGSFGLLGRWVKEESEEAIDTREYVDYNTGEILNEYLLPRDFSVQYLDISDEFSKAQDRQAKINAGVKAREACQSVLDYIAGANLDKELTIQQITSMQTTYANAEAALRAGRPTYAKQFISAITPDGIIITAAEKANCLSLLSAY